MAMARFNWIVTVDGKRRSSGFEDDKSLALEIVKREAEKLRQEGAN
jgi:hypothetical protein